MIISLKVVPMAVSGVFVTVIQIITNMQITLTATDGSYVSISRVVYDRMAAYAESDRSLCAIIVTTPIGSVHIIDVQTNHL